MAKDDLFIIGGARTPMTQHVGALKDVSAIELGAIATRGALARTGVAPGCRRPRGLRQRAADSTDAIYGARHVGLRAGLPIEVPALTVNRLCGSGFQAVVSGAQQIRLGEAEVVLAGGTETMSQAPHVLRGVRGGLRLGRASSKTRCGRAERPLRRLLDGHHRGELRGQVRHHPRAGRPLCAAESSSAAHDAGRPGGCTDEVCPSRSRRARAPASSSRDEHPRPETTLDGLTALPTVFKKDGVVTAGNASGIRDGAAALVLRRREAAKAHGLVPLARLVSWAAVGVDPTLMGMGPVPAIRKALERAGLTLDIDLVEVNEAFAPQYLACEKELGLDPERNERQRRRDRTWASAGRQRCPAAPDPRARAPPPRRRATAWARPASAAVRESQ